MGKFYITTPIYYVNDVPHVGHAYTTIAADVLARYHRRRGDDVFFLTGTDEHGANVAQVAKAHGKSPKEFCDKIVEHFQKAWRALHITNDFFIRTTDPLHEEAVQVFMSHLYERGEIYKGKYEGKYCLACERFLTEEDLVDGLCPDHRSEPVWYSEENYFFTLSKYQDILIKAILDASDPNHYDIAPLSRRNEVLGKIRAGLSDISISRASLSWGVPLPFDPTHTTYVWIDALLNYISAIGYKHDPQHFAHFWPADVHLMAKDILWFHAIVWPALLISAGLKPPRKVFAHGFFTVEGQKMSKTLGNVLRPQQLIDRLGASATRYLLLSHFPFGTDGDVSLAAFSERYNADLANDLGNLLNRTLSMINRYYNGAVPAASQDGVEGVDGELIDSAEQMFADMSTAMDDLAFSEATAAIWRLVARANKYVEENAPWNLAKRDRARLDTVIYNLAESLRLIAVALWPFMPEAVTELSRQLGIDLEQSIPWDQVIQWGGMVPGTRVRAKPAPLFPRVS
ncbi:MAG: methionine--tRNA ligase [Chloroflexi bacterium]|nr:methionine--tRNA ligase [Chloroflexota bacterium]MCL5075161.1 methionine--tRNA ligase [Chloroflexota bacterium]